MSRPRVVEPELLDSMPPDDPRAILARRDLRRVNAVMGHGLIWQRLLQNIAPAAQSPLHMVDLGAGDGSLLLGPARRLAGHWPPVFLQLLDRRPAVSSANLQAYAALGWRVEVVAAEVGGWLRSAPRVDLMVSNLFLHHFSDERLMELFRRIRDKTGALLACEPRRSPIGLLGSRLLGLIGCGPVTRYDAVVSVRAGFVADELTALWRKADNWRLHEAGAGLFSHVFIAMRSPEAPGSGEHDP